MADEHNCEDERTIRGPQGHVAEGTLWQCSCGQVWQHFCGEAEGCYWLPTENHNDDEDD